MSLTRGKKIALALAALALAASAAFGVRAWRAHQRHAALAPALPARPDLVGQPAALVTRRWREYFPSGVEMGDSDRGHLDGPARTS